VAASNVFLAALLAAWLLQGREYLKREATSQAQNITRLIGEELSGRIDRIDLVLLAAADESRRQLAEGRPDRAAMSDFLDRLKSREPDLLALYVTDERGMVSVDSPPQAVPVDVSDRPFFEALRDDPEAGLLASGPFIGRKTNKPIVLFSRRISGAFGSFAGVANGSVELAHLSTLMARADTGTHGIVTLRWSDMSLVASSRPVGSALGSRHITEALEKHIAAGHGSGTYEAVSSLDGVRRVYAFARLRNAPMYVLVGLGLEDFMGSWWRQVAGALGFLACFLAASIAGVFGAKRALRRREEAEEERDRLREQVVQAQKLESIGQLAGGIAHDFNNLLTVILGSGEVIRACLEAGKAPDPEDVEQIMAAGGRARDLTRSLLTFARKQVSEPTCLDLNAVVAESERLFRRTLRENVRIVVRGEEGLWKVWCDPVQVQQVLMNLAVNAGDAMPEGGTLTIETANLRVSETETPSTADSPELPAGDWVGLTVTDNGVGMAAHIRDHLFEPFFTTKPKGSGTGLGLATVHGIVSQAGGRIVVTSEPGRGTQFQIWLPRTDRSEATRPVPPAVPPRGTETVLVVEDDMQVRNVIVGILRQAGYQVLEASQAEEARSIAGDRIDEVALMVTDVVMPGPSGPTLAEQLRRRRPDLKVLFVSGYPSGALERLGTDPTKNLLAKPFTATALLERVRQAIDASGPPALA